MGCAGYSNNEIIERFERLYKNKKYKNIVNFEDAKKGESFISI